MGAVTSLFSHSEILPSPEVLTNDGNVRGKRVRYKGFQACDVFLGIPFARPPIGALRFCKPQPPERWKETLRCCHYKSRPIQKSMIWDKLFSSTGASEDCLYLNVFAPEYEKAKLYHVMFYIHGGGYVMDSAARLPVQGIIKQIVSKGIVVVTVEYRLGFLGFFSTGDEACKGNMGMFDQAMALQWTRDNIKEFGGDPANITVAGQSAGGASADLLSISPVTRDLFHKKILMGGCTFTGRAMSKLSVNVDYCLEKAKKLGWKPNGTSASKQEENRAMMEFLRTVPAPKFATTLVFNDHFLKNNILPLAPVYDEEFLPRRLDVLRDEAPQMPSICGVGEFEGLLYAAISPKKADKKRLEEMVRAITKDEEISKKFLFDFPKFYGESKSKREECRAFIQFYSDLVNNHACYRFLKHSQTQSVKTFAYSFDYTHRRRYGTMSALLPFHGGTHTSEIIYLFQVDYYFSFWPWSQTEKKVLRMTSEYFTNFVRSGDVNGENTKPFGLWSEVFTGGNIEILSIQPEPNLKEWDRAPTLQALDDFIVAHTWNHETPGATESDENAEKIEDMTTCRKQTISQQLTLWASNEPMVIDFVSLATETQDILEEKILNGYIQLVSRIIHNIRDNSENQEGEIPPEDLNAFLAHLVDEKVEDTLQELSNALKTLEDISNSLANRGNVRFINVDDTDIDNPLDFPNVNETRADVRETSQPTAPMRTRIGTHFYQPPTLNIATVRNDSVVAHVSNTIREPCRTLSFDGEEDDYRTPTHSDTQAYGTIVPSLGDMRSLRNTQPMGSNDMIQYPVHHENIINFDDLSDRDLSKLVEDLSRHSGLMNPLTGEVQHSAPTPNTHDNYGMPMAHLDSTRVPISVPLCDSTNTPHQLSNNRIITPDDPVTCPIPWDMAQSDEGINVFNRFNGAEARERSEQLRLTSRRLTEAEIDTFTGEAERFRNFWLSYRDTIAIDCHTDSARFECLKRKCSGAARSLIDGYPVTSEGFEQAVTALFEHYNDDEVVAHAALTKLAKITRVSHDYSDLENKFGEIRAIVMELTARNQTDNIAMQNLILDKFPETVKTELWNSRTHYEIWNTAQMMKCLAKIVRSRAHNQRIRTLRYEADAAVIPCIFCNTLGHRSKMCTQFSGSKEDWERIITHRRCIICIESGHEAANCPNGCCGKCGTLHNSLFCDLLMGGVKNSPENSVTPNKSPALQSRRITHDSHRPRRHELVSFQSPQGLRQNQFVNRYPYHSGSQYNQQRDQSRFTADSTDNYTLNFDPSVASHVSTMPKPALKTVKVPRTFTLPDQFSRDKLCAPPNANLSDESHVHKSVEDEYVHQADGDEHDCNFNPQCLCVNSENCGQDFFRAAGEIILYDNDGNVFYNSYEHESDPEF